MGAGRAGGPSRLALRLAELRANQAARRVRMRVDAVELDELRACKLLAHRLFGALGVIEFDCDPFTQRRLGPLRLGYFIDPKDPRRPGNQRRVRILFQAASHRELVDQVRAWSAAGRPRVV